MGNKPSQFIPIGADATTVPLEEFGFFTYKEDCLGAPIRGEHSTRRRGEVASPFRIGSRGSPSYSEASVGCSHPEGLGRHWNSLQSRGVPGVVLGL